MFIKLKDYDGELNDGDSILMSHAEFIDGGKDLIGVPVTVTPDGEEPKELNEWSDA